MAHSYYIDYETIGLELDESGDIDYTKENFKKLNKYIWENPEEIEEIERGDIINTFDKHYRNDGKFIWDGRKAVFLYFGGDFNNFENLDKLPNDYGIIPPEFVVDDHNFSPDYWEDELGYNSRCIYLCEKYRREICENIHFDEKEDMVIGEFNFKGQIYPVCYEDYGEKDIPELKEIIMDMEIPITYGFP